MNLATYITLLAVIEVEAGRVLAADRAPALVAGPQAASQKVSSEAEEVPP